MKILIIKPSSFGDIVQSNPVLAALKQEFPGAAVHWLVFSAWQDLLDLFPGLDGRMVWDRNGGLKEYLRVIRRVRSEKYDLVIDLQGLARTALVAFFSGAKRKIGVPGMKELSWLIVREVFPESGKINAAARALETVRYLAGKKREPVFNLAVSGQAEEAAGRLLSESGIDGRSRIIALVPSARGRAKEWPLSYYEETARMLMKEFTDARIIALGSAGDAAKLSGFGALNFAGRTDIGLLAGILKRCAVVVGNDTGPVHLASALGVPVVAVFGGSDVSETAPVAEDAVVITKNYPCSPCRGKPKCSDYGCLADIKPAEVFGAVKGILKK
ncbi:MAG: glycosyltransferase family 9 protein [Endomicrobiales bacterium]|nr:glycosyltransferase family 9 protein [Endomicrobiales bacterium]